MAKDIVRTTKTVERLNREGDATAGALKEGMKEFARLTVSGYVAAYWACMDDSEAKLDVFKRVGGQFMKKGELVFQQTEPEEVEGLIIASWGMGTYQLRPMIGRKYYSPVSVPYKIGDVGDEDRPAKRDGIEELVGQLAIAKQLKDLRDGLMLGERKGEDEGMKAADMQAMIEATTRPLIVMSEAAERRAAAAEQRNHELQMKLMDMANGRQQTVQSGIGELVKLLPKEALSALLAPADAPGWAEKAVDALREFGPALAQMLMEYFRPGAGAAAAAPGTAALPAASPSTSHEELEPTRLQPGGRGMPIQLNAEQTEAKKLLIDCIKERDFDNAYAMIEGFPGFTPTPQGPMPIGAAFLSLVDPKVTKPRIYVIQMMQLVPELSGMLAEADAFVSHIQQRLMRDQEAFLKEQQARRSGAHEPRPTTHPEEDERA